MFVILHSETERGNEKEREFDRTKGCYDVHDAVRVEEAARKNSSSGSNPRGKNNKEQSAQNYLITPYDGQAGSMGPSFTDVDWSLSNF